jgi:hypothetical protein
LSPGSGTGHHRESASCPVVLASPSRCFAQVIQRDDVVALQHRRRPVARERHHRVRVVPGVNEMPHAAAPKVMDDSPRESQRGTGTYPLLP